MLYETIDRVMYPCEIDIILDVAVTLCPAMKRCNAKMYPANAKLAVPSVCVDDERAYLVAILLNALADEI